MKCDTDLADVQALGARTAFVVGQNGTVLARDGVAPKAYAPSRASVVRGSRATLKFKVTDALPNGAAAAVTIKVKKSGGRTVKTLSLGTQPLGRTLAATFRCTLPKGTYRFSVYAVDRAGNKQSRVGTNTLVVR